MFSSKLAAVVATIFASVLAAPAPDTGAKPFTLKDGEWSRCDCIQFTFLSTSSACTDGDLACINGQFAQIMSPSVLWWKIPINVLCSQDNTEMLGLLQLGQLAPAQLHQCGSCHSPPPPPADNQVSSGDKRSFTLSGRGAAQALNKQFVSLTTSSSCTAGQNACVNNQFVECVDLNSPGTSITCVDNAQAVEHIAVTGAGSSLTGN
ncbi:hypothetical protein BU17DRAFT_68624 [Hysterangium stoloniferum]|nr:hypothetical protein BU17DRAFT_68624 [Hysterangium stoloniferum]